MGKSFLFSFLIFCSLWVFANDEASLTKENHVNIFKYKYENDCSLPPLKLEDMQKELIDLGVDILSSARGYDGVEYFMDTVECNKLRSQINIFTINETFLEKAQSAKWRLCSDLTAGGGECYASAYQAKDPDEGVTAVYKPAQALQCQLDSGVSLEDMEKELKEKKIIIYKKYYASDGLLRPLKCSEPSSKINVYVIERADLWQAIILGYKECGWLERKGGGCHTIE